jgi:hypothetical protein
MDSESEGLWVAAMETESLGLVRYILASCFDIECWFFCGK